MKRVKVGIIGGAGYTGGEAIRILVNHDGVELVFVHSNSNAGNLLSDVHADLLGDTDMRFTGELDFSGVDVIFLCVGHGDARKFLEATPVPASVRVIDLSQDFRLAAGAVLGERDRVRPARDEPEKIREACNIANPAVSPPACTGDRCRRRRLLRAAMCNISVAIGSTGWAEFRPPRRISAGGPITCLSIRHSSTSTCVRSAKASAR